MEANVKQIFLKKNVHGVFIVTTAYFYNVCLVYEKVIRFTNFDAPDAHFDKLCLFRDAQAEK
jgi:hypothetical protein